MAQLRLFHVSEEPEITSFFPRPVPSVDSALSGEAVWAIDESHLPNYLLPRDCPRIAYSASGSTSAIDREKFGLSKNPKRMIAIESKWISAVEKCELFLYELPVETFQLQDPIAGYHISRKSVKPISVTKLGDLFSELKKRNTEIQILPDLIELREKVISSTLDFSIIRFRNAKQI